MHKDEMNKHIQFLHKYAIKHNIIFRVSRLGISVEELS